jgi:dolichyl-phosphate beta-glucosyltransferase
MSINQIYLSIVIPCYNESKKIVYDIEEASKFLVSYNICGEIIIVDDGSTDNTYHMAEEYSKKFQNIKVLTYGANKGKGYALKTGILVATGRYILFADAGLCVPFENVQRGIAQIESGASIAIGSRRVKGSKIFHHQPLYRKLGSRLFHFISTTIIGIPKDIQDSQCGFKLFTRDAAHFLYSQCVIDRFMIDIEMILRAKKAHLVITEFPVEWKNDPDTRFNPINGTIQNIFQLIKIKYIVSKI